LLRRGLASILAEVAPLLSLLGLFNLLLAWLADGHERVLEGHLLLWRWEVLQQGPRPVCNKVLAVELAWVCFLERGRRDELSLEQSLPVLFARLRSDYRDVRLRRGFVQTEEFGHTLFCAALDLEVVVLIVSTG